MFGFAWALAGCASAYGAALAQMTPEQLAEYLTRQRARREMEILDNSPEVLLARQCIANEDIQGEHAARLLGFARQLARRHHN